MATGKTIALIAAAAKTLQACPTLQPIRLLRPWDLPGKSTGVGCHLDLSWQSNVSAF